MELEQDKKSSTFKRPVAKYVLIFMVIELFTSLKFPYAHFPTTSTAGAELFLTLQKVISWITRLRLLLLVMVLVKTGYFLTCAMKRMTKWHTKSIMSLPMKAIRSFISNQSHLIKIVFQGEKLWVRMFVACFITYIKSTGKLYTSFVVYWAEHWLATSNAGQISEIPGVSIVHKLKYEHVHLTRWGLI